MPRHPIYWFSDGSVVLNVGQDQFKVHASLLARQSPLVSSLIDKGSDIDGVKNITLDVDAAEVVMLLEHLYHDKPLSTSSGFQRVAAVLRVSSQLDFQQIHAIGVQCFEAMVGLRGSHFPAEFLEEALEISTVYNVLSVQKSLFYNVVTTSHMESLSPGNLERCSKLMASIIDYFTPMLFTPPATSHMACTDVFADTWMPLVIKPALGDDGVYKPIETLDRIKAIDWGTNGLCHSCLADKKAEWSEEQETIWQLVDQWLA
ncbi:hypothetical protein C8J56DRAFT_36489 [Mycena floridula]|nr:hypothetical protein C8J56DRAFT_36489 [Mycena floridula]